MSYSYARFLPPMEALTAVLAARRHGSFSAAAEELGITHAAVSRRIHSAERWAGMALFERQARGVVPTIDGQRILAQIEAAVEQLAVIGAAAQRRHSLPTVRLACTPAIARFWLVDRMAQLEGAPADLRVEVLADMRVVSLESGDADLAIRYGRGGWRGGGSEEHLFRDRLVPVGRMALIGQRATQLTPREILAMPLLYDGDTANWRHWAASHGLSLRPKAADRNLGTYALAVDAALAGLGIALWKADLHPVSPDLYAFSAYAVPGALGYFLVQRTRSPHAASTLLAERIRAAAR